MGDRHDGRGRGVLARLAVVALAVASCTKDDRPVADASSSATIESLACGGSTAEPVMLEGEPGVATVTDVVVRSTGQVVAIGSSMWIRDPDTMTWRSSARPGGPDDAATAGGANDGEVWVVTDDLAAADGPSRLFRSSDLETWVEVPFVLDGATTASAVYALTHDGDGWLALAQDADAIRLITSPDGLGWTTTATLASQGEADTAKSLFDLAILDEGPTSVGLTVGGPSLRPLEVVWSDDGSVSERPIDGDDLAGVRLWALTPLADGRVVVAADRVALSGDEATGFTPILYERSPTGGLDLLATMPAPAAFAAPADLAEVGGGQTVVVGSIGDSRDTLAPAAWTVCLP